MARLYDQRAVQILLPLPLQCEKNRHTPPCLAGAGDLNSEELKHIPLLPIFWEKLLNCYFSFKCFVELLMGLASGPGVFMLEGVYINNFFIAVTKFLRRSNLKEERYFGPRFKGIVSFIAGKVWLQEWLKAMVAGV